MSQEKGYLFHKSERQGAKPIKHWTRGVVLHGNAKVQLERLSEMPFIHSHVAAMPDVHWGMGATVGSVIATKQAIIPAAVGVDIGCFVGETKIPLLDGTQETLVALEQRTEPFWVYSIDKDNNIVPGRARCVRTRKNAELMRVVVSGGEEIICTPDHQFMLNDGSYKEAKDLNFNDSLMPLYRRWQTRDGYESVSNGERGAKYLRQFNTSPRTCDECGEEQTNPATLRWHKQKEHGYNHKVISTQHLDKRDDVYCLQVDEYHNFALAAGVFVHNCGMMAIKTTLTASDLPENLAKIRSDIERTVPHGFVSVSGRATKGNFMVSPQSNIKTWMDNLYRGYAHLVNKHPQLEHKKVLEQLGTMGGGNHFIEVCLDENDQVWVMLHSGSRGIGNKIGRYFIDKAKEDMRRHFINLPDTDLSYLVEGTEHFDEYTEALLWAQDYAAYNRELMMSAVMRVLRKHLKPFQFIDQAINCHHNYATVEHHFGANVWVTRKGAVRAREGDLGIIPGSMGTGSFIVRGLGNADSFCSCSHGAGRVMSRGEAKKQISLEEHAEAMKGIEARLDADVLDESPAAYKDISAVMAAQSDLVEIVHRLRQVLNVKG